MLCQTGRHTPGAEAPFLILEKPKGLAYLEAKALGSRGVETQADVVCGPVAVVVAEDGFEEGEGVGDGCGAIGRVELVEDAIAECVEPGFHAIGEWGGAGNQVDGLDGEACFFEESAIDRGRGEEAGCGFFCVDSEGCEGGLEGCADGGNVALAS